MLTFPTFLWRGNAIQRALTGGVCVGVLLGIMAWLDSGMLLAGVIVFVILTVFYSIWMARRMKRYWPGAKDLTGEDRAAVVRAARRGERIGAAHLAQAVIDYGRGVRAADENARPFRWVVPLVLVVSVATAAWDAVYGSWGNAVVSGIYLVLLLAEMFWWPQRRQQLLANTDRAAEIARHFYLSD